jgi:hypothetical protein
LPLSARTTFRAAVVVAAALGLSSVASADDEKAACVRASEQGQRLRDEGKLTKARDAFITCARSVCPAVVKKDCDGWLSDIEQSIPSVVVSAQDPGGGDVTAARVLVDGQLLAEKLDGRPLMVDPGEHTFRYEYPGAPPVEEKVVILTGQHNRVLKVKFGGPSSAVTPPPPSATATAPPPPPVETSRPAPPAVFVLGGVGLAALASFAYFGASGRSDISDLRSTCAPYCAQDQLDSAKKKLLVADISLGVGVVALGAAVVLFVTRPTVQVPSTGREAGFRLDVRPAPGGGVAELRGSF